MGFVGFWVYMGLVRFVECSFSLHKQGPEVIQGVTVYTYINYVCIYPYMYSLCCVLMYDTTAMHWKHIGGILRGSVRQKVCGVASSDSHCRLG